jgi:hypothetical protein
MTHGGDRSKASKLDEASLQRAVHVSVVVKRAYTAPAVTRLGSVQRLTAGGVSGPSFDATHGRKASGG